MEYQFFDYILVQSFDLVTVQELCATWVIKVDII
jgi:hypothetical protein